jgi:CRISPR-associated protein Cmr4
MLQQDRAGTIQIDFSQFCDTRSFREACDFVKDKAFIVQDKLFTHIVNDNLEVRTSVAIDPATGAAEDGALFTFEAIPRATILWFNVVYSNPTYFRPSGKEIVKDRDGTKSADISWVKENVEMGLRYFKALGIGGMNTRGMGRLDVLL